MFDKLLATINDTSMKSILIALFFSLSLLVSAQIIEAPHLDVIEKELLTLKEGSLVVFDVDLTLIVPHDKVLTPCGQDFYYKTKKEGISCLGSEKISHLISIILLEGKSELINPKILNILNDLKNRQIKVIALTAVKSGPYGLIPHMENWRLNQLNALGISFHDAFPDCFPFIIEACQGQKNPAVFKNGILFSGNYPKGEVLKAFLDKVDFVPSKVVFVDDHMDFIQTVESACAKDHILSVSFHYTEAINTSKGFDKELAQFQWDYLVKYEKWLSDEEARDLMSLQNTCCLSK